MEVIRNVIEGDSGELLASRSSLIEVNSYESDGSGKQGEDVTPDQSCLGCVTGYQVIWVLWIFAKTYPFE